MEILVQFVLAEVTVMEQKKELVKVANILIHKAKAHVNHAKLDISAKMAQRPPAQAEHIPAQPVKVTVHLAQ